MVIKTSFKNKVDTSNKEINDRYGSLVETSPNGIAIISKMGVVTFCNPTFLKLTGYSEREIIGKHITKLPTLRKKDIPKYLKMFIASIKGTKNPETEFIFKTKSGELRFGKANMSLIKRGGKVIEMMVILRDITAEKKAELAFKKAQEVAQVGHWELDLIDNKLTWSDEIYRIFEIDPKKFGASYEAFLDMIHPDDRDFVDKAYAGSVKNKKSYDIVHRLLFRDGKIKYVNERCQTEYDENGKPICSLGTVQDITDRKKAEKELENSENRFKRLSQSSKEGIVFHDKGKVLDANRAATKMIGIKLSDYIGMNALDFLTPDSKKIAEKKMRMGNEQPYEVQLEKTNGKILDVEVIGKGIYINGRKARVTVIRDITDRKKAEKELEDSENRFKRLSESANEGIIFHDDGILLDANQAAAKMMDVKLSDTIGMNALDFLTPDSKKIAKEKMRMGYEQPYEAQIQKPNGKKLDVELIGKSAYFNNKKVRVVIIRDITERKKSEIELKKSHHKTEKALSGTIKTLATIVETRDPYTSGHQKRVAKLARAISLELGMDKDKIKTIHTAALIHDIGKINVPASILAKPGKISDLEYNMIKTHSFDGYKILKKIEFQWPLAKIVLQHHERENGSGFPEGLKNKKIMLEAKIIAVADVVEAMSSHRPYRPALGIDKALKEIKKGKGKLYDTKVVEACVKIITKNGFKF